MKRKHAVVFHNTLDSRSFLARMQEEAEQSNLLIEQSENAFNLRIDAQLANVLVWLLLVFSQENIGGLTYYEKQMCVFSSYCFYLLVGQTTLSTWVGTPKGLKIG